jgi:hypothetical protein
MQRTLPSPSQSTAIISQIDRDRRANARPPTRSCHDLPAHRVQARHASRQGVKASTGRPALDNDPSIQLPAGTHVATTRAGERALDLGKGEPNSAGITPCMVRGPNAAHLHLGQGKRQRQTSLPACARRMETEMSMTDDERETPGVRGGAPGPRILLDAAPHVER